MNSKLESKIKNLENIDRFPAEELLEFIQLNKEDELLDIGAGTGYISFSFAKYVKKVVAFDYDHDILQYLEAKAKEKGLTNIETTAANIKEMPLENEIFDKAVASISLHEVQPLSMALSEIYRVLKDKGLFLCIELEKSELSKGPRVSSKEMEEKIVQAGFSVMDTFHSPTQVANQPVYIIIAQKNK
ncbi:SAM-dependent methyltransferase [Chryseobacterium mucoviscidosis]|uniref:class I SAM-dependent methyltransferase n=1 Tax=unclassified Paenibacillus TaxID=185978 RepID=UPI0009A3D4D0|nr:class I SAM-dependent methyltransferase [Paenibacillus sp. 11B]MDN8587162.1 class I SAM-dependent methyltransferase [Paenibacillus sp. 11B]OPG99135.1 SAM-dependent methyltransferase [Chryseobacterium mucoviscidosis]